MTSFELAWHLARLAPPRHHRVILLASLLLLFPLGSARSATPAARPSRAAAATAASLARDQAAIREALAQHVTHYNARDWKAMRAEYTEDALVMPSDVATVQGGAGVNALYQGEFAAAEASSVTSVMEARLDEVQVHGDVAFDRGTITIVSSRGGYERRSEIRFMNIRRRQPDGGWKISHSMDNPVADSAR